MWSEIRGEKRIIIKENENGLYIKKREKGT
jgi:hypothetical protein